MVHSLYLVHYLTHIPLFIITLLLSIEYVRILNRIVIF